MNISILDPQDVYWSLYSSHDLTCRGVCCLVVTPRFPCLVHVTIFKATFGTYYGISYPVILMAITIRVNSDFK